MSNISRLYKKPVSSFINKHFKPGKEMVDGWDAKRIATYQCEALTEVLMHAWTNNEFYRRKFEEVGIRPSGLVLPEDMRRVPFTTKDELRNKPWLLLSVPKHSISQIHVSTGTTGGDEIYIPHTWEDLHVNNISPAMRQLVPISAMDVVINALPYEMSSSGLAFHRTFQKGCGAMVVPVGKGGYYSTPFMALKSAIDMEATVLVTTPSYAIQMSEVALANQLSLENIPLRFMWLTGEGCSPAMRDRIEKIWGHAAYFYYGSLEAGPIGIECNDRSGYHIAGGHVYVEVVDQQSGELLSHGEIGEIVVTELTRQASPLIRYKTGDIGYIEELPCGCGVPLLKLHLRGRSGDQLQISGKSFSPYYLEQFLMQIPEVGNWYQFFPKAERLIIKVEVANGYQPTEANANMISSRMEYAIGSPVEVYFIEKIPRTGGKTIRVIHE